MPTITPFQEIYTFFDTAVVGVLTAGTTNMIALISPLVAAGFALYVMLVVASYLRGDNDDPIQDFLYRMLGWGLIITLGLNATMYTAHVVPFINGLGDDLAGTVGLTFNSAAALDEMINKFLDAFILMYTSADGIKQTMFAVIAIFSVSLFAGAFMVVAIAYIILAKLSLGILIAVGPLFIASALFPATRDLFKAWTAQILNYAFLVMLFSFAAQIEIAMVSALVPAELSISSLLKVNLICAVMVFVSLNLPSLASSLAGGVGISSMVGKLKNLPGLPKMGGKGPSVEKPPKEPPGGGEIKGKPHPNPNASPPGGGAMTPEQKK
jgi:type IV secretion system protein VirB6